MLTQVESLLLFTFFVAGAMALFYFREEYLEKKRKRNAKQPPAKLDKAFIVDFNSVESKARVSYTDEEKAEVDRLIEIFQKQYSHYPETRYNVQILQCINRMRNKGDLNYRFEFQN